MGNSLAALGYWLEGATLYVGKVLMTAGTPQEGSSHVGRMNQRVGCACVVGSCKVAATEYSQVPSVPVFSGNAHRMPHGPSDGAVILLEVEPTFLAYVANPTWHDANKEMRKFAPYARGLHALFHVKQLHGFDLVFRGSSE